MASFKIAFERTNRFEGGYTADPEDNGNWTKGKAPSKEDYKMIKLGQILAVDVLSRWGVLAGTKYGISAPVLMRFLGRLISAEDMKNLSHATVEGIYRKNYWQPIRGDEIKAQPIANDIYDEAVNAGVSAAISQAQAQFHQPKTGKMDDVTLKHLNNEI